MTPLFFFGFFPGIGGGNTNVAISARITGMGSMGAGFALGLTGVSARITSMGQARGTPFGVAAIAARLASQGSVGGRIAGSVSVSAMITGQSSMRSSLSANLITIAARLTTLGRMAAQFIQSFAQQPATVTVYPGPWAHFEIDTLVRFTAAFDAVSDGSPLDPTTITLFVVDPTGTETSYAGPQLTRDSIGNYHLDLILGKSGRWAFKWQGTGIAEVTSPDTTIVVNQSQLIQG